MYGISQSTLDKIKSVLFSIQGVEQVILYGTSAEGNYKEGSDIDLTVKGNLVFDDLVKMSVNLDDLNLPWKIDLSLYSQIKNDGLLEHINRVGVAIL
jgi:predicted nucleotidyltransferase